MSGLLQRLLLGKARFEAKEAAEKKFAETLVAMRQRRSDIEELRARMDRVTTDLVAQAKAFESMFPDAAPADEDDVE